MSTPRLFMPEMISVHFAEGGNAGGGRRDGRLSSSVLFLDIPNILQRQSRISPPRHRYRNSLSLIIMFNSFHHTYHYDDGWTQSVFAETDHSFGKKCSPDSVDNSVNHPACILPSQCAVCTPPCSSKYHQPVIWQNTQPQSLTHTHTHTHTQRQTHMVRGIQAVPDFSRDVTEHSRHSDSLWARHGKVREEGRKSARGKIQAYRVDGPVFPICKKKKKFL